MLREDGKRVVPVGMRFMLGAVAGLVLSGAITVFWSAYVVNQMKDNLVEETLIDTQLAASQACDSISALVVQSNLSLEELADHPEIQRQLHLLSDQAAIVMADIIDGEGRLLVRHHCPKKEPRPVSVEDGRSLPAMAYEYTISERHDSIIPMEIPIRRGDDIVGAMQLGISRQLALGRIQILSTQITASLILMVLVVLAILMLTIVLVYYAFQRQLALTQEAAQSGHLADLGALASGLAHEIRNPLHAMSLHLEVAKEDLDHESPMVHEDTVQNIQRVQTQIERLNSIVTNFLSLSIPCRMQRQEMRIDHLIREVAAFLKPEFEDRSIALELDLPEEPVTIQGDSQALHQVLMNILINARQALEKVESDRRVLITLTNVKKGVRLTIDDSGHGIPAGEEESIFKTFVTRRDGGTGFGLSIARRIVEGHDGVIRATKAPIGGARIEIELR